MFGHSRSAHVRTYKRSSLARVSTLLEFPGNSAYIAWSPAEMAVEASHYTLAASQLYMIWYVNVIT